MIDLSGLTNKKSSISIEEIIDTINKNLTTEWSKKTRPYLLNYLRSYKFYCLRTKLKTSLLKDVLLPKHGHLKDYETGIILFPNNVTVEEAVCAYKNPPQDYTEECSDLILFFKEQIKTNGFIKEIIIEKSGNKLFHVDGLHRMIALSILIEEGFNCESIPIFLIEKMDYFK
jgi:hypothetical protein